STQIQVTFQNFTGSPAIVNHAGIGVWNGTLADTTATPVELTFGGGNHGFNIASAASITSDLVNLSGFTASDKLVVIIDMNSSGPGAIAYDNIPGFVAYYNSTPTAASYNVASPGAGYSSFNIDVGVTSIDVSGGIPAISGSLAVTEPADTMQ